MLAIQINFINHFIPQIIAGQKTTYEDIFKKGFEDGEVKLMPTGEIEAELLDKV